MKRVNKNTLKKNDDPRSIKWKVTGGPFYLRTEKGLRRITKADGPFYALPEDIPESFRDNVQPVNPVESAKKLAPQEVTHKIPQLRLVKRGETEFYDILDQNNKRQNEQDLSESQAVELMDKLQSAG